MHWLPVWDCIKLKIVILCYHVVHGLGSVYMSELLWPYQPSKTACSVHTSFSTVLYQTGEVLPSLILFLWPQYSESCFVSSKWGHSLLFGLDLPLSKIPRVIGLPWLFLSPPFSYLCISSCSWECELCMWRYVLSAWMSCLSQSLGLVPYCSPVSCKVHQAYLHLGKMCYLNPIIIINTTTTIIIVIVIIVILILLIIYDNFVSLWCFMATSF